MVGVNAKEAAATGPRARVSTPVSGGYAVNLVNLDLAGETVDLARPRWRWKLVTIFSSTARHWQSMIGDDDGKDDEEGDLEYLVSQK